MTLKLSALIEEYLIDCRARRLAPKTIAGYRAFLGYFRDWLFAAGHPDALRSFTLPNARRYSQDLAERHAQRATFVAGGTSRGVHALVASDEALKSSTAYGYLRPLKTFSRWLAAEEQGYLASDVLKGLRLPRRPQAYREPLTEEEMGQLVAGYDLRAPIGARDFAILMTYLGTGLRATELTSLREQDVHLDEEYLRVESGKGGKSRTVSLHPEVVVALVRYRNHFRPATADPHFFVTRDGRPMTYGTVALVLRRGASRARSSASTCTSCRGPSA